MTPNTIINGNSADILKTFEDDSIDLTVTSPPYDNLRDYNGYTFDFETIADNLYRVTKPGGVVVWIVGDSTVNGSETLTSFKQALYFQKIGFNVHDTMIYQKNNFSNPSSNRYHQIFEYMFVFSKGKPKTFNPIKDRKNIYSQGTFGVNTSRKKDGEFSFGTRKQNTEYGMRYNIWKGNTAGQENMCKHLQHPAMFPLWLAKDHILSWSNKGDLVLDPFMGSGTTAVACIQTGRDYIGIEVSPEYVDLSLERIRTNSI